MNWPALSSRLLLTAAESSPRRTIELALPEGVWEWLVYGGGFAGALALCLLVYLRDTRRLPRVWSAWLMLLRLTVWAALLVIAVAPQERTARMGRRPSRVALLVDTSLSMRFPEGSRSGGARPGDRDRSRADAVRSLLTDTPLLAELARQHEVSLYTFDAELAGPFLTDELRERGQFSPNVQARVPALLQWLEPRGAETRLGEALVQLMRQINGSTLSGIVVVTDGGSNAGVEPATAQEVARTERPPVRLLAVGVGDTEPLPNLRVADIQAPTDVHLGDGYDITALVHGQGLDGRAVEVELLSRPEGANDLAPAPVGARIVSLQEAAVPVEVKFPQAPPAAGAYEYFVRARPAVAVQELSLEDNERRITLRVVERKTRVLLIAGGPMREFHFVRNLLYRHPTVASDVWLQTVLPESAGMVSQEAGRLLTAFPAAPTELSDYDVIIAFDADWSRLSSEGVRWLADWVARQAGGLILVAGDIGTARLATADGDFAPVTELYPVFLNRLLLSAELEQQADQAWPVKLTPEGQNSAFLELADDPARSADAWREFPGVFRCYPSAGKKAGATVYAEFTDPRRHTEHGPPIFLAAQFFGAGRTLYVGSPELWRLRALSEEFYDRFWIKAVREVAQGRLQRGSSRGTILLERERYVLGQSVSIRAQLYDEQLQPLAVDSVAMEVTAPDGTALLPARRLHRDPNHAGQYVGDLPAAQAGTYRIELAVPSLGAASAAARTEPERLTARIDVVPPDLESDHPEQNAALLHALVRDTGGAYVPLHEAAEKLPALLPDRSEEFLIDERLQTLWDRPWVLWGLVGLLGLEWLTRKLLRLA